MRAENDLFLVWDRLTSFCAGGRILLGFCMLADNHLVALV